MEFRILGPLEVVEEEDRLPLAAGKQRALLAILLLRANEVVSVDELIDALWGERPPGTAAKSIQIYVSQLRKLMRNGSLLTRPPGYELRVEPDELDLHRFRRAVEEGKEALAGTEPAVAAAKLREALALWRGSPLAEFTYEPFAQPEIARLEEERLNALEERIEADLALGRHADLVGEVEALLTRHPLRERLRGQLMLALYRCGRQAEALDVYQDTRRRLRDELGLDPDPSLQQLQQAILRHDSALAAPKPSDAPALLRRPRTLITVGVTLLTAALVAALFEVARGSSGSGYKLHPNTVGVIDPKTNDVVAEIPVGSGPKQLAFGSGALWVANWGDNTISRVDPVTRRQVRVISLNAVPTGLATTKNSVWVTTDHGIKVIDPAFDEKPERTVKIREPHPTVAGPYVQSPNGIAFTREAAWVINGDFGGHVLRRDAKTHAVEQFTTGNSPAAIASGHRNVCVTDVYDNTVSCIEPTGAVDRSIPVGQGPASLTVCGDAIWVADRLDDDVKLIEGGTVVTTIPHVGDSPNAITCGAGSVWVANRGDGTVSRIDPRKKKVVRVIKVGGRPVGLVFARGFMWVTVQASPPITSAALAKEHDVAQIDHDAIAVDPASQDAWNHVADQLDYATCAKLLNYPDKPGRAGWRLQPEVAASMPTVSQDGKTYVFTIRRGYTFSPPSSKPVTAKTFKYTIERALNPKVNSGGGVLTLVPDIVGEQAYVKGTARHIAGVVAHGKTLSITLTHPAGDLPARISVGAFCAVPTNTPMHPIREPIPSAGPYYVAEHFPGVQTVLKRNPNYRGPRPHQLREIVYTMGFSTPESLERVRAGQTDVVPGLEGSVPVTRLNGRYGPNSPAAHAGHQQFFIDQYPMGTVTGLTLNTSRGLFRSERLRRAVNYAIDRMALARAGEFGPPTGPLTATPTDQYLPPGMPAYQERKLYPLRGDVRKARQLAGNPHRTIVMYTCNFPPCPQEAEVVKRDLAAIGMAVDVRAFPIVDLFKRQAKVNEPYDIGLSTWRVDYPDPYDPLNLLLDGNLSRSPNGRRSWGANGAHFDDPVWNSRLEAAARLNGAARDRAYARLDADLARKAAPWVAFENENSFTLFSARIGCQTYQPIYGMDLATLCLRK